MKHLFIVGWLGAAVVGSAPWPVRGSSNTVVSSVYRASVTAAGNSTAPLLSTDGNRVLFLSHAPNLVTNEELGPHLNLFARDVFSDRTVLVSVSTNGHSGANASVTRYSVGSIGVHIVLETAASNLATNDTNDVSDVFLQSFDGRLQLISVNAAGTGPGNGRSFNPLVSRYGERVIFESEASDLVANDTNGVADIFVREMRTRQTHLVSVNGAGTGPGNGPSGSPFLTEYGAVVAFISRATDLVPGVTNTLGEVYVRDLVNPSTRWAMAGLLSNSSPCLRLACPDWPDGYVPSDPVTFESGRVVVFKLGNHSVVRWDFAPAPGSDPERVHTVDWANGETLAPWPLLPGAEAGLVGYAVGRTNAEGVFTNTWLRRINFGTAVPSVPSPAGPTSSVYVAQNIVSGPPTDGRVFGPFMSLDGGRFIFASDSTRLLAPPTDGSTQVYFHEMGAPYSVMLSARTNGSSPPDLDGVIPSASRLASSVVWDSPDATLVTDDLNDFRDVFLHDLNQHRTTLFSPRIFSRPGVTSPRASRLGPHGLSGDGKVVALTALDGALVANDTNTFNDAFVMNLATGARTRVTMPATNEWPSPPALNLDGRYAVFERFAYLGPSFGATNCARADLLSNSVALLARPPAEAREPSMSADGRYVAFQSPSVAGNITLVGTPDVNGASDVFVHDFDAQLTDEFPSGTLLASVTRQGHGAGNDDSRGPAISPDGHWVAFHSLATDLTYDTFPVRRHQVFAFEQHRGAAKLLSYTPVPQSSNATALSVIATNPIFSADSRYVFFTVHSNAAADSVSQCAIFRHDLLNDPIVQTRLVTNGPNVIRQTNFLRLTNVLVCHGCANPSPNADGSLVAYETAAADASTNVAVRDLKTGTTEIIGLGGSLASRAHRPIMSLDGVYVTFTSTASGPFFDFNNSGDVFVHDRRSHVTHLVSRALRRSGPFGGPPPDTGNGLSSDPVMSADGRTIAFQSFASDLVPGDYNDARDVFVVTLSGPDTDGDGLADDWEAAYFNSLEQNGAGDFDADGMSNRDEYHSGMDPTNAGSVFRVLVLSLAPVVSGGRATVIWSAVPGRFYRVQAKASVTEPWTDISGDVFALTSSASKTIETAFIPSQGYFRAVQLP
jgi:Tol biopolymer transport system component